MAPLNVGGRLLSFCGIASRVVVRVRGLFFLRILSEQIQMSYTSGDADVDPYGWGMWI
jgi:hypothetical protein